MDVPPPNSNGTSGPDGTGGPDENKTNDKFNPVAAFIAYLGLFQTQYMDAFANAMQGSTDFMAAFSAIRTQISSGNYIKTGSDSNHVNVDGTGIKGLIQDLIDKYSRTPIFTSTATGDAGKAEATAWANALGLDPHTTVIDNPNGDGTFIVTNDVSALATLLNAVPNGDVTMAAAYQAFMSALDTAATTLNGNSTLISQATSRAYSLQQSLVQVSSSMMDGQSKTNEGYFQ
jgi:Type III secretion systems tip complex components